MALTNWIRFVPGRDPDTTLPNNRQISSDFLQVGSGSEEKNRKFDDSCDLFIFNRVTLGTRYETLAKISIAIGYRMSDDENRILACLLPAMITDIARVMIDQFSLEGSVPQKCVNR